MWTVKPKVTPVVSFPCGGAVTLPSEHAGRCNSADGHATRGGDQAKCRVPSVSASIVKPRRA